LIASLGLFLFGPSKVFGLQKENVSLTLVGLALLGVGAAAIYVPLLSDIIEAV
jgi:hypothetical protein